MEIVVIKHLLAHREHITRHRPYRNDGKLAYFIKKISLNAGIFENKKEEKEYKEKKKEEEGEGW